MCCQSESHRCRFSRSAVLVGLAFFTLGSACSTVRAADPQTDAVRKLEEQLRRSTDRIGDLQKTQKLEREENAKLRETLEQVRQSLVLEKKKAEEQLAASALESAKTTEALKEAIRQLERTRQEGAKFAEEARLQRQVSELERKRAQIARDEEEAQRARAEKAAQVAQEAAAKLAKEAAAAATDQKLLQERGILLEKRVAELERELERVRIVSMKFEGKVTSVAPGLVKLNLGSAAGLTKGQVLEVYRLEPKPLYLGQVAVVEVTAMEATTKPVGARPEAINVGDRVTTKPAMK